MRKLPKEFPTMTAQELRLTEQQLSEVNKEVHVHHVESVVPQEVGERYKFSSYLIDPNRKAFSSVTRLMAYVLRFVRNVKSKVRSTGQLPAIDLSIDEAIQQINLTEEDIQLAERYYLKRATEEVLKFVSPKKFEPISTLKDGILTYKGRILPNNSITIAGRFTEAMLDLSPTTFCVPVIDRFSPVAYALAFEAHYSKHDGIEATLRRLLKKVFIIDGRILVKRIKKSCERCCFLEKRTIQVVMGPIPSSSLNHRTSVLPNPSRSQRSI